MRNRKICFLSMVILLASSILADDGPRHQERRSRPIPLGVSGGNNRDITSLFCCGGTLGALVSDAAGKQYILSNNHVIGKSNKAEVGQEIGQPGLIDTGCRVANADPVAHFTRFKRIKFNNPNQVDAAIAEVISGRVNRRGRILDIGRPGRPREASLGLRVKKSGRTTGRTVGKIVAINTTVLVDIPRNCEDEEGRTARFVDQFVVQSTNNRPFTDSGDSGSLIVTRKRRCPRSVGLLFAGDSEGIAVANRIQTVLSELNVSIVGCGSATSATATMPMTETVHGTKLDPAIAKIEEIRQRNEERLLRIRGVVAVGIGEDAGTATGSSIVVFVRKDSSTARSTLAIPPLVEGVPTKRILTSGFRAF